MTRLANVTAIILCGGQGRRMGGSDKPLMLHEGRRLIEHIADIVAPLCGEVLISANRNEDTYRTFGEVIADRQPDRGPLEGMAACLHRAQTPWAFVCPGDAPGLSTDVVRRLYQTTINKSVKVTVAHDGSRRQHLHLLLATELADAIDDYLGSGGRSVHGWLDSREAAEVNMADLSGNFVDLDQPGDLDK